jgi:O-antigen ligase
MNDKLNQTITRGLGLMMLLVPAIGVPNEYMLQDTLKSMVVSFFALGLVLWYLRSREACTPLQWHGLLVFPVVVCLYALGSMAWATNSYLAGVETVRWFLFALLVWLGLQTFKLENFDELARWIHAGSVAVTLWGLMQFWFDLQLFPQGYAPAATFVNRNFAAEFVVAVFPVSVYAMLRTRTPAYVAVLSYSLALNLVFVLACSTRSALVGLVLTMIPLGAGLVLFREQLAGPHWDRATKAASIGVFIFAMLTLGFVPSKINTEEFERSTAISRTFNRAQSFGNLSTDPSLGMRTSMMRLTFDMIADNPVLGAGAGNWEVVEPKYLKPDQTLEVDYYLHNEFVQHVAEYGLLGLLSVLGLNALLALAAWRTWCRRHEPAMRQEGPLRVVVLCSLFALFVVSCAGFPWRLASTCALFAIGLGLIGASESRMGYGYLPFKGLPAQISARGLTVLKGSVWLSLGLSVWISYQAGRCEFLLVKAAKLALGVTASTPDVNNPQFDPVKMEILAMVREGMAINPHYRKVAPITADEMARWGDWPHAVEIWESVLKSRPYIVAIMLHAAKARAIMQDWEAAKSWLDRARLQQPNSVAARSVEVYILDHQKKYPEAARLARQLLDEKHADLELTQNAYRLGLLTNDPKLSLDALERRMLLVPWEAPAIHIKAAEVHVREGNTDQAMSRYREAVLMTRPQDRERTLKYIPDQYADKLRNVK